MARVALTDDNGAFYGAPATRLSESISAAIAQALASYTPPLNAEPVEAWAHWGDSMTAPGTSGAWVTKLSGFTGLNHYNGGVGGQTAEQISARMLGTEGATYRDRKFTIAVGRNGFKTTEPGVITGIIADMLAHFTVARRGFVFDVPPWVGEHIGTGNRAKLDTLNTMIQQRFPTYYLPVFASLRTQEAATAAGITFTAQDLADIEAGLTPASFRMDDGHLNDAGGTALEHFVRQAAVDRGYAVPKPPPPPLPTAHTLSVSDYSRRYVPQVMTETDGAAVTTLRDYTATDDLSGTGYVLATDGTKRYIVPGATSSMLEGTVNVPDGNTVALVVRADDATSKNNDFFRFGGRSYRRATSGGWQIAGSPGSVATGAATDGWKIVIATADSTAASIDTGDQSQTGTASYYSVRASTRIGTATAPTAQIAEVVIWSRKLTTEEQTTVRAELAAVYGLA